MTPTRLLQVTAVALVIATATPAAAEAFIPLGRQEARALVSPAAHSMPTIVALWSSNCPHCKSNLQLFAGMAKSERRLKLVTVAAERPHAGLDAPLNKLVVPGQRFAYGEDAPEAIAFALDPKWRGELPRTLFFDGHGNGIAVSGVVERATALRHLGLAR